MIVSGIVSGVRELFVLLLSNRYIYRIPIKHDMIGKVISINRCKDWLEIEVEVKESTPRVLESSKLE